MEGVLAKVGVVLHELQALGGVPAVLFYSDKKRRVGIRDRDGCQKRLSATLIVVFCSLSSYASIASHRDERLKQKEKNVASISPPGGWMSRR